MSKASDSILRGIHSLVTPQNAEILSQYLERNFGQDSDKKLQNLGSGSYAYVFWLSNKKYILKLTHDTIDASGMTLLRMQPLQGFIKVYDTFQLQKGGPSSCYGIVAEKLNPLSSSEKSQWTEAFHLLDYTSIDGSKIDFLSKEKGLGDLISQYGLTSQWMKLVDKALENPEFKEEVRQKKMEKYLACLRTWSKGFDKLGIKWGDLHEDNIMTRGRDYIMMDLGGSSGPRLNLPILSS